MEKTGPFGLWQGMRLEEFENELKELAPCKYRTSSPPKPHSAFEFYVLQITPKTGLAWVKAIGVTTNTNVFGSELRNAFESMEKKLNGAYGSSKKIDLLMPGSIWEEPQYWMQALQKKDRVLGTSWNGESRATLKDSLSSVFLGATALDTEAGLISIEYSFKNAEQSDAEIAEAEDGAL